MANFAFINTTSSETSRFPQSGLCSTKTTGPIALTTGIDGMKSQKTWIFDTGATSHMTPYANTLQNVKEYQETVTIGNGTVLEALQRGTVKIETV